MISKKKKKAMRNTVDIIKVILIQCVVLFPLWLAFDWTHNSIYFVDISFLFFIFFCYFPAFCLITSALANYIKWSIILYQLFILIVLTFGCYFLSGIPSFFTFIKHYF